jgi:hypothetical protein
MRTLTRCWGRSEGDEGIDTTTEQREATEQDPFREWLDQMIDMKQSAACARGR